MPRLDYFNNNHEARKEWYRRYRKNNRVQMKAYNQAYYTRQKRQRELATDTEKTA